MNPTTPNHQSKQSQSDVALKHIAAILATRIIVDARKSEQAIKESLAVQNKVWSKESKLMPIRSNEPENISQYSLEGWKQGDLVKVNE